jgi:hypothetical protein
LQLTDADDAFDDINGSDGVVDGTDGTVNLNTSLSALAAMGIDSIEADADGTVGTVNIQGYGSDEEVTGLVFADDLTVNLQLTDADDAFDDINGSDGVVDGTDGTVNLNTSLSALADMGIDSIEADADGGVGTLVITDGFGEFTLDELSSLGLTFDDDLSVTVNTNDLTSLGLSDAVEASLMLGTGEAAETLKDMGIDFINGPTGLIDFDTSFI